MQALNPLMLNFFLTFQICSLQWMPGCVLLNCGTGGTRMTYRKYVNVTLVGCPGETCLIHGGSPHGLQDFC